MQKINPQTRERILEAADALAKDLADGKLPTVDAVRKTARVSMNDASEVMKEWRARRLRTSSAPAPEIPASVADAARDAVAAIWEAAAAEAARRVESVRAQAEADAAEADELRQELAAAADAAATDAEAAKAKVAELEKTLAQATESAERLEQRIAVTQAMAAEAQKEARTARDAERAARDEAAELRGMLKMLTEKK